MRLPMGAFSSRVSRRAFSGPLLKHGRRLRPPSFSRELNKGHGEKEMKTLLLLPFKILWFLIKLPFKILKVIFGGASIKSGGMFN